MESHYKERLVRISGDSEQAKPVHIFICSYKIFIVSKNSCYNYTKNKFRGPLGVCYNETPLYDAPTYTQKYYRGSPIIITYSSVNPLTLEKGDKVPESSVGGLSLPLVQDDTVL